MENKFKISLELYDRISSSYLWTDGWEDDIKDIVDMLGFKFAYGIEYQFNEQLSFSTDYGINYLWNDIMIEDSDLSARLGHSYTLLSLNFSME